MNDLDIQLIPTDKLSTELTNRFDGLIIYGIQKDPKNNNKSIYYDHWKGDHATLLGLCDILKRKIYEDEKEKTEDV